jgi:hypothetical protein
MAIVGAPLPPEQIPTDVARTFDRQNKSTAGWARIAGQQRPAPPNVIAEWTAIHAAAVTAWKALAPWKRIRWSICAWRQGNPSAPPAGYIGWSGFSLYWQCWRTQNPPPGHQPISPCARRRTDPGASYWDFTP